MKLIVDKTRLSEFDADAFLRRAGYAHIFDRVKQHDSYIKRLSRDYYPRLHVYVSEQKDAGQDLVTLEMHLDQKKASYAGVRMHSAEYDSPVVAAAIDDLKNLLRASV
jgi:hypothetical protein